jgi:hypothetical protein
MIKILLIITALASLQACTTPAIVTKADESTATKAKGFEVDKDRAKIYFVSGKVVENMFNMKHSYSSDFIIDGNIVGSKNKDDALVFDLKPGKYNFSWNVRSTDPIDKNAAPQVLAAILRGGDILILQGDYSLGGAGMFGLIGSMISPPKTWLIKAEKSEIQGKNIVLPQNCDLSLCLK